MASVVLCSVLLLSGGSFLAVLSVEDSAHCDADDMGHCVPGDSLSLLQSTFQVGKVGETAAQSGPELHKTLSRGHDSQKVFAHASLHSSKLALTRDMDQHSRSVFATAATQTVTPGVSHISDLPTQLLSMLKLGAHPVTGKETTWRWCHKLVGAMLLVLLAFLSIAKCFRPHTKALSILGLCVIYNLSSACMIETNKWLMSPERFPFPVTLASGHMFFSCFFSNCLCMCCPSFFPSLQQAERNWSFYLKILPIGCFFCASMVFGNAAYSQLSLPFLQVMKESNIVIVYALAILCGVDLLSRCRIILLATILLGTLVAVHGEMHFKLIGFLLQLASNCSDASKIVIQGVLMSGSRKLDPLTLLLFMAPACFFASLAPLCLLDVPRYGQIFQQLTLYYPAVLASSTLAFFHNVVVALCISSLSPVGYIVITVLKDMFIVASAGFFFGESLTMQQWAGFGFTLCGVTGYLTYKQNVDCFAEDELIPGFSRVLQRLQGMEPKACEDAKLQSVKDTRLPMEGPGSGAARQGPELLNGGERLLRSSSQA